MTYRYTKGRHLILSESGRVAPPTPLQVPRDSRAKVSELGVALSPKSGAGDPNLHASR